MNARPTTEQLLLDCARELMEDVLPTIADETTIVRIAMIEQVLRNAAARCAQEIDWMVAEIPGLAEYARAVLAAAPDDGLGALLRRLEDADDGLGLDAVTERYARAGELFAAALEVAVLRGSRELQQEGERLLDARLAREEQVMAGWSPAGR
ncbi:hypothetical protein [Geodermatophilus sp. URMC 64]